jgi:hypothetical protein
MYMTDAMERGVEAPGAGDTDRREASTILVIAIAYCNAPSKKDALRK